jgi:Aerotolerance regulator N-terminal
MILGRPLLLVALIALPILYLLARRARRRTAAPVSSLLIWSRMGLPVEPPADLARRADRLLWVRLLAALLVALGMAGPLLTGRSADPVLHVLLDTSPSMGAFEKASRKALDEIQAAAPEGVGVTVIRAPGLSGLPSLLARSPVGEVLFITDHIPEGLERTERVRTWAVGEPVENVGLVSAWLADGRFGAVIRNFASSPQRRTVRHPEGEETIELEPGESREIEGSASGGVARIDLLPPDRFVFDDSVELRVTEAVPLLLTWRGPDEPSLRLALEVAGVTFGHESGPSLCYRSLPVEGARLVVSPPGERRAVGSDRIAVSLDLPPEACPPPGLALGSATTLDLSASVLMADDQGPLAVREGDRIVLALDPGDPASAWASDPSFPVLISEFAHRLGARPAGFAIVSGALDPEESATRPAGFRADLGNLTPEPPTGPGVDTALDGPLYLLAAALLLFHYLLERRRAGTARSPERASLKG